MSHTALENERKFVQQATALYGPSFVAHLRHKGFTDPAFLQHWAAIASLHGTVSIGPRVLDVGCGPGWSSMFLAGRGCQVTAVDISADMLAIAKENAARFQLQIDFREADMANALPTENFDTVLILDALHHCPDENAVIKNCFAALRPGGHIILVEPDWFHEYSPSSKHDHAKFGTTERGMGFRRMRRALRSAGFINIRRHYNVFDVPGGNILRRLKSLVITLATLTVGYPHRSVIATALRPA